MRFAAVELLCGLAIATLVAAGDERAADDSVDAAVYDARIEPAVREHWAFRPIARPKTPAVKNAAWPSSPIDRFVLAKLEEKGWQPSPPASPTALLRRMYLGLIGLPPTPQEVEAFLAFKRAAGLAAAVERTADDLLARPAYGERWARHWLDLVRYAETNGYERDAVKPHVWRYRDYVIKSLNADKPFDRFAVEQLAGDELADASSETVIATGYWRLGPWDDEPADPAEDRYDQLDDMVSTTAQAFLGLTLGCARCHDHKFEPLTQLDYYRLVAVVNPLRRFQNGRADLDAPAGSRAELASAARERLLRAYFPQEPSPTAPPTFLLKRGKATSPGPRVPPGVPAVLVARQPKFDSADQHTSRRRASLAQWMVDRRNPLVARVIVNRVWQHHFGEGLVRTPSDFGVMGDAPTHPELLDWLADWFVEQDWSLKSLHRLILTSRTYQMSKSGNSRYAALDPENRLLWRVPYRRLEVEAIRDSMLAVSGQLNRQLYGPSIHPFVPKEALASHSDPDKIWPAYDEPAASRRTIYAHIKRSMVVPMLEVLDLCDATRSSGRRDVTTVAPQALSLFNGHFVNEQARRFAERLVREAGDDLDRQIDRAYQLALARRPQASERQSLRAFVDGETDKLLAAAAAAKKPLDATTTRREALVQLCRVIFNLNEFVYAD